MDVPTLIVLGAVGGFLRGAVDLYVRFREWLADRHVHQQRVSTGTADGQAPRFGAYVDSAADSAAAAVHSLLGAAAAVLFGTTGQISGHYAALVVGLSAPMLLTQLSHVQAVSDIVTGNGEHTVVAPGAEAGAGTAGDGAQPVVGAASSSAPGQPRASTAPTAVQAPSAPSGTGQGAADHHTAQPAFPASAAASSVQPQGGRGRQEAAHLTDDVDPQAAARRERRADRQEGTGDGLPHVAPRSADRRLGDVEEGSGSPVTPRLQHRPVSGEEGLL